MSVLIVGNVVKDIYLNLDPRSERMEVDKNGIQWLNIAFDASKHYFFRRTSCINGAGISLEICRKFGVPAKISHLKGGFEVNGWGFGAGGIDTNIGDSDGGVGDSVAGVGDPDVGVGDSADNVSGFDGGVGGFDVGDFLPLTGVADYRYVLNTGNSTSYFTSTRRMKTRFVAPKEIPDYIYVDRSANLDANGVAEVSGFLQAHRGVKLIVYYSPDSSKALLGLLPIADVVFWEKRGEKREMPKIPSEKMILVLDDRVIYGELEEKLKTERFNFLTHLSAYSILAGTILGALMIGASVEESFKIARLNLENARLTSTLSLPELRDLAMANGIDLRAFDRDGRNNTTVGANG